MPGSYAEKAGLRVGDTILRVGDESVVDVDKTVTARKIRGDPTIHTPVSRLVVQRPSEADGEADGASGSGSDDGEAAAARRLRGRDISAPILGMDHGPTPLASAGAVDSVQLAQLRWDEATDAVTVEQELAS